jgi:hypothetical protein
MLNIFCHAIVTSGTCGSGTKSHIAISNSDESFVFYRRDNK